MRTQTRILLFVLVSFVVSECVNGEEPISVVEFPNPREGWKAFEYEEQLDSSIPWNWAVFVNSKSGDLLSFAARSVGPKESRAIIFWSDTAREIFPIGHPAWISSSKQLTTSNTIRNHVVEFNAIGSDTRKNLRQEALEYTLVVEVVDGRNRMVHGYALLFDGVAMFVQHTSNNPITSDLAKNMAKLSIKTCRTRALKTGQ